MIVNATTALSIPDDTFEPSLGEAATIRTTLGAGLPVRLLIKNQSAQVVRKIVDQVRAAGIYNDTWDGRDNAGNTLPEGPYFAVLEYDFGGEVRSLDLTNTTGGARYNPPRNSLPRTFRPFEDNLLEIRFTIPDALYRPVR